MEACRVIYTTGSDEDFWYAEARALGAGAAQMRHDHRRVPVRRRRQHHARRRPALRGSDTAPRSPRPAPARSSLWVRRARRHRAPTRAGTAAQRQDRAVSWEEMYACCEEIVRTQHGTADGRVSICIDAAGVPAAVRAGSPASSRSTFREQAAAVRRACAEPSAGPHAGRASSRHACSSRMTSWDCSAPTRSCRIRSTSPLRTSRPALPPAPASSTTRARSCRSAAAVRCRS